MRISPPAAIRTAGAGEKDYPKGRVVVDRRWIAHKTESSGRLFHRTRPVRAPLGCQLPEWRPYGWRILSPPARRISETGPVKAFAWSFQSHSARDGPNPSAVLTELGQAARICTPPDIPAVSIHRRFVGPFCRRLLWAFCCLNARHPRAEAGSGRP